MAEVRKDELEAVYGFLGDELPALLDALKADLKPVWGLMTPHHMLEHLIVTYKMSIGRINIPMVAKEEDQPRIKAYLVKDSPMRRSVPSPTGNNELQPLRTANIEEAKEKVLNETAHFLEYVKSDPGQIANHPYGGPMTAEEWLLFHRKHIKHHFIQFGLIPDYE